MEAPGHVPSVPSPKSGTGSAMFATISSSARIRRLISTRGRAITNNTKISMARAIVGNRATSGSDQRPMYATISYCARRPIVRPIVATDRTINRDGRRPMVGSIVASCDRSCEHSIVVWSSARSVVAPDRRS